MPDPRYIPTPAPRPSLFDAQADDDPEQDARDATAAELAEVKAAITVSADDVGRLRRQDVYRVLEWTGPELRPAVANYVREHRPDLSAEVGAALLELEENPNGD